MTAEKQRTNIQRDLVPTLVYTAHHYIILFNRRVIDGCSTKNIHSKKLVYMALLDAEKVQPETNSDSMTLFSSRVCMRVGQRSSTLNRKPGAGILITWLSCSAENLSIIVPCRSITSICQCARKSCIARTLFLRSKRFHKKQVTIQYSTAQSTVC